MATLIKAAIHGYYYLNEEVADPRVQDWFMMGSPWPMLMMVCLYHYFVRQIGPRLMANRKPFNLDRIIPIYNLSQILVSLYIVIKALELGWLRDYSFTCEPVDYSPSPRAVAIARTVWLYFNVKMIDLLDTVFFVLRKKENQVTFLHTYHHTCMVIGSWIYVKYIAGGHATFLGSLNSFVHVIMYTHYFVTSLKLAKPWWKKYLTQMQLVQFLLIIYHYAQLLWTPSCGFPLWPSALLIPQNIFMFVLFSDFYYKVYVKKRPAKPKATNDRTNRIEDTTTTHDSKTR